MYAPHQNRTLPAFASLAMVAAIGAVLVSGLRPHWQAAVRSALVAVDFAAPTPPPPPPPPPPPRPAEAEASAPKGDPGASGLKARATPVFAPKVQPPLIAPPPIVAAPVPNLGAEASNGASTLPGPGQGAGAYGNGLGGGGTGGNGSGGGGVAVKGPRQIAGHLSYDDLPQGVIANGQQAGVEVRYRVEPDGTVSNCRIDRSSGFPALDATACRLIEQRFRFRPARDSKGQPVADTIAEEHTWTAAADH